LTLEELLAGSRRPVLLVAADGLNNAENIGALVRNCAALGATGLLAGETCSTPWMRRSVRSSMGTVFDLPIVETASLVLTLRGLRNQGVRIIGAHPHTNGCLLAEADLSGDVCLVMGSEGTGLGPEVLETCDQLVAVPMHRSVDSLNVTSASAVFLYEAQRQRGQG
jgi:tRNA G18 (ribose-2'-O)-methylase SpoU